MTDSDLMAAWTRDQSPFTEASQPVAVVRAETIDDVVTTMRLATESATPVVSRGKGTGLSGGANASPGCIMLSLDRMDSILAIDPLRRTATVQPGVINADLGRAAARHGLRYTPDPGSRESSTIGGNIATNAGGMSCCKYGVTGDHVAALTAVLADGSVIRSGGATRKNAAGLDLTRLLVGSEGTLAVVVEATMWLRPHTDHESTLVAMFSDLEVAMRAVGVVTTVSAPSAVELLDRTTLTAVNNFTGMGIDANADAILLMTFDGLPGSSEAAACEVAVLANGATEVFRTDDPEEGLALMNARRMALPALERLGSVLLDDICVPLDQLPGTVSDIQTIATEHGVTIGTFGHAADGNLHPTIVYNARDDSERDRAQAAFTDIIASALARGGTISGEHGIGSLKQPYMRDMYGLTEIALMHRIKRAFDPAGILNPGRAY